MKYLYLLSSKLNAYFTLPVCHSKKSCSALEWASKIIDKDQGYLALNVNPQTVGQKLISDVGGCVVSSIDDKGLIFKAYH